MQRRKNRNSGRQQGYFGLAAADWFGLKLEGKEGRAEKKEIKEKERKIGDLMLLVHAFIQGSRTSQWCRWWCTVDCWAMLAASVGAEVRAGTGIGNGGGNGGVMVALAGLGWAGCGPCCAPELSGQEE